MVEVDKTAFIAQGAKLIGDVVIEEGCGVWYNAVLRGDRAKVVLGKGSNVQDCAVLHVDHGCPCVIGNNVTIGHSAIVHACTVGDNALIGMGATILNGASIGKGAMIGAGALVTKNAVIPEYSLAVGVPAKVVRKLTKEEIAHNERNAEEYIEEAAQYKLKESEN